MVQESIGGEGEILDKSYGEGGWGGGGGGYEERSGGSIGRCGSVRGLDPSWG